MNIRIHSVASKAIYYLNFPHFSDLANNITRPPEQLLCSEIFTSPMQTKSPRNMIFEYMVPSSWWSDTTDCHHLVIDLPGFKKEEVRLRADKLGHVIISGERQVNENKIIHFHQSYKVPLDSAIEETTGNLEDSIFYITIPKKLITHEKKDSDIQDLNSVINEQDRSQSVVADGSPETDQDEEEEEFHDPTALDADDWNDEGLVEKVSKKLNENRAFIFTAVLAFSLGVLISHQYQLKIDKS